MACGLIVDERRKKKKTPTLDIQLRNEAVNLKETVKEKDIGAAKSESLAS